MKTAPISSLIPKYLDFEQHTLNAITFLYIPLWQQLPGSLAQLANTSCSTKKVLTQQLSGHQLFCCLTSSSSKATLTHSYKGAAGSPSNHWEQLSWAFLHPPQVLVGLEPHKVCISWSPEHWQPLPSNTPTQHLVWLLHFLQQMEKSLLYIAGWNTQTHSSIKLPASSTPQHSNVIYLWMAAEPLDWITRQVFNQSGCVAAF